MEVESPKMYPPTFSQDCYLIQNANPVKFICVGEYISKNLTPQLGNWVSVDELLIDYSQWVGTHACWQSDVLEHPAPFVRKVKELLAAKGWPHVAVKLKGVRGISGIGKKHREIYGLPE